MHDRTGKPLDGPLMGDRPHYLKLYGSYRFPFGLIVGTVVNAMSGVPVTTVWNAPVAGLRPFNRMDLGRTPFLWFTNLYAEYGIKIGASRRLSVNINIDNLFNTDTAQRIYEIYNQGNAAVPQEILTKGAWNIDDYKPRLDPRYKMAMDNYSPITARAGFKLAF
jgi:outer membrane receptor for ferric coprogen and ferric-rhodotorulic acid